MKFEVSFSPPLTALTPNLSHRSPKPLSLEGDTCCIYCSAEVRYLSWNYNLGDFLKVRCFLWGCRRATPMLYNCWTCFSGQSNWCISVVATHTNKSRERTWYQVAHQLLFHQVLEIALTCDSVCQKLVNWSDLTPNLCEVFTCSLFINSIYPQHSARSKIRCSE